MLQSYEYRWPTVQITSNLTFTHTCSQTPASARSSTSGHATCTCACSNVAPHEQMDLGSKIRIHVNELFNYFLGYKDEKAGTWQSHVENELF